jgi:hypothetical protein
VQGPRGAGTRLQPGLHRQLEDQHSRRRGHEAQAERGDKGEGPYNGDPLPIGQ